MSEFLRYLEPSRPYVDWQRLLDLRWKRTRKLMHEAGIDAILTNVIDNVIYLAGWPRFRTSVHPGAYGVLFFQEEREPVVFCSEGDSRAFLPDAFYKDIRVLPPAQSAWLPIYTQAVTDYGLQQSILGLDSKMTASLFLKIRDGLNGMTIVDAAKLLNTARSVKNTEEIKAFIHTASLVEAGVNTAMAACRESWGRYTEIEAAAEGMYEMLRRGCYGVDIWCVSGERTAPVRRYSTDKIIRGGELAVIDGPAGFNGMRCEFARTVWTGGRPKPEHKRLYQTVWASHVNAMKIMKPGTTTADLEIACLEPVKEAGLEAYYGGYPYTGHGIGIKAEGFNITARYPEMSVVLEPGMLLNLEPAIWWDGVGGVRIEDTYLITENGYEVITRAPYEEELLN